MWFLQFITKTQTAQDAWIRLLWPKEGLKWQSWQSWNDKSMTKNNKTKTKKLLLYPTPKGQIRDSQKPKRKEHGGTQNKNKSRKHLGFLQPDWCEWHQNPSWNSHKEKSRWLSPGTGNIKGSSPANPPLNKKYSKGGWVWPILGTGNMKSGSDNPPQEVVQGAWIAAPATLLWNRYMKRGGYGAPSTVGKWWGLEESKRWHKK